MTIRERLPNRRPCESFGFRHAGLDFTLCAGSYPDGRVAEIFLSSHKPGSPVEAIARDAAVTVSIALQFGADLETTALGAALDAIAGAVFLSSHKPGSPVEAIARDAAVTVSIALQFGADLETTALGAALDAIAGAAP